MTNCTQNFPLQSSILRAVEEEGDVDEAPFSDKRIGGEVLVPKGRVGKNLDKKLPTGKRETPQIGHFLMRSWPNNTDTEFNIEKLATWAIWNQRRNSQLRRHKW